MLRDPDGSGNGFSPCGVQMRQTVACPCPNQDAAPAPAPAPAQPSALARALRGTADRYSPDNFYGLDLNYRATNPRFNPRSHFVTISKGLGGRTSPLSPASSPRSPRPLRVWGSPLLSGQSLVRAQSLPALLPSVSVSRPVPERAAPSQGPFNGPCPAPQSGGVCKLMQNSASEMACVFCGIVVNGPAMVSGERASYCPKEKARDQVGEVQLGSAEQASQDAWIDGPERPDERERRIRAWAGGTHMSQRQVRRMDVQKVHNAISREAWKDARARIEGEAREELVRRKIIAVLELIFKSVKGLKESKQAKRIRLATIDLYTSSMQHERACTQKDCMFALSKRSNMAVAYGVTEYVLAMLLKNPADLAELTGGNVMPQTIKDQLSQVRQLQLVPSGHSQLQQVTSAIGLISRWKEGEACRPCLAVDPVPPELLLPPSLVQSQEQTGGKRVTADPGDSSVKLRLQIVATSKLCPTFGKVRDTALKYLAVPQIMQFLTLPEHQRWPVELVACLMIRAVESKLEREDSTTLLRTNLLEAEDIRPHTFLTSAGKAEVLMQRFQPPKSLEEEQASANNALVDDTDLFECN